MTERERHDYTASELTAERGAHAVTQEALRKSEAALAKSNALLLAANLDLVRANLTVAELQDLLHRAQATIGSVLRLLGEAGGRPRVAPPSPSAEQIQDDFVDRRSGR